MSDFKIMTIPKTAILIILFIGSVEAEDSNEMVESSEDGRSRSTYDPFDKDFIIRPIEDLPYMVGFPFNLIVS